jgi:DNA-directed RNA polymerase subunit RPC12/RpoP
MLKLARDRRRREFTPHNVARTLRRRREEEKPSEKEPRHSDVHHISVDIDILRVVKGVIRVADFLARRSLRKRVQREQKIDNLVLRMAQRYNGIVGIPDLLMLEVCSREEAERSFQRLKLRGECLYLCDYQQEKLYVFPLHLCRVWHCEYCESEFPVLEEHHQETHLECPNCSARLHYSVKE